MKVFGIGLNKTGTKTLSTGLRELGYPRHITFSLHNLRNFKRGNIAELVEILTHFDSCEDWPWPLMFDHLDQHFPTAQFILTIRQTPEIWFNSLCRHAEYTGPTEGRLLVYGYAMPHDHYQHHLNFYLQHNQRVRDYFKNRPGKLLEVCWENGDEWAKLCQFLDKPLPAVPFPHVNKNSQIRFAH